MTDDRTSVLSQEIRQLQACRGSYEVMRSGLRRVLEDLQRSYQALISQDGEREIEHAEASSHPIVVDVKQYRQVQCSGSPTSRRVHVILYRSTRSQTLTSSHLRLDKSRDAANRHRRLCTERGHAYD